MRDAPTPCTWLVQATVRGHTRQRLEDACAECGRPLRLIRVIPFSEEMPADLPDVNGPFLFYGYTTLLLNAFRDPRWRPGVFFDPALFRPSVYLEKWGRNRLLNDDAEIVTMREFSERDMDPARHWFVRPDDDLKRFTGSVMTHGEFRTWYDGFSDLEGADVGPETRIAVSTPKSVTDEWRVFLLDGRVIGKSGYSNEGHDLFLPPELEAFAVETARIWSPAPAFVLDVTYGEDATPRLLEANCINGSGFYFADTTAVVRALSQWQESQWAD